MNNFLFEVIEAARWRWMGQNVRILVRKRKYRCLIFTTIHMYSSLLLWATQNFVTKYGSVFWQNTYIILRYMWDICKCLDSSQLILSPNSTPKGSLKKQCYIGYSLNSVIKYSILMLRNRAVKVFGSSSQSVFCAVWGKVLSDLSTYF